MLAAVVAYVARADLDPAVSLALGSGRSDPGHHPRPALVRRHRRPGSERWPAIPGWSSRPGAEPYYAAVVLDDPHQVAAGRLSYGIALALMLGSGLSSAWRRFLRLAKE